MENCLTPTKTFVLFSALLLAFSYCFCVPLASQEKVTTQPKDRSKGARGGVISFCWITNIDWKLCGSYCSLLLVKILWVCWMEGSIASLDLVQ